MSNIQEQASLRVQAKEELKRREEMREKLESDHSEIRALIQSTNKEKPDRADIERL